MGVCMTNTTNHISPFNLHSIYNTKHETDRPYSSYEQETVMR